MAHLTVEYQDDTFVVRSQEFCCTFTNTDENQKTMFVILRSLSCPETDKSLFTHQQIADAFGKNDRRDIDNFMRDFRKRDGDFLNYLARKNTKKGNACPEIERQILESPLLSIPEQHRIFCQEHPQKKVSEKTFREYVNDIPATKILNRVRGLGFKKDQSFDLRRYLEELLSLDRLSQAKKKEIVEQFPKVESPESPNARKQGEHLNSIPLSSKVLAVILYVSGLPQDMVAMLFNVSKTSIHNWIYSVCSEELYWDIVGNIAQWSGQVSFDEKWVKIKGIWHFVLCAVDKVSGFPLLMEIHSRLDKVSWTLFFKRFKVHYGKPKLIQSDGSQSLAAAREIVFPGVRYQLCKFHKLKNLMKRLREQVKEPKRFKRLVRLAKHIFANKSVSSRKHAAKTLQKVAGGKVSSYIDKSILAPWRNLTMSLTTNASERFNRKIEKCFSGRYGISSVESANVLLRGLFLKELLLNGKKHLAQNSQWMSVDLSRICQEELDMGNILHFFHDYEASQVEKLA
jgi:transposase-like protein